LGAGLPVILSPECYLPQVAEQGAGLIVEPTVTDLTAALRYLLTAPADREMMGHCGKELIKTQFTWDAVALKLEKVYQSLVAIVE
jgi:poly(glycerol-phosphate) alpha-glucosyltransferase